MYSRTDIPTMLHGASGPVLRARLCHDKRGQDLCRVVPKHSPGNAPTASPLPCRPPAPPLHSTSQKFENTDLVACGCSRFYEDPHSRVQKVQHNPLRSRSFFRPWGQSKARVIQVEVIVIYCRFGVWFSVQVLSLSLSLSFLSLSLSLSLSLCPLSCSPTSPHGLVSITPPLFELLLCLVPIIPPPSL